MLSEGREASTEEVFRGAPPDVLNKKKPNPKRPSEESLAGVAAVASAVGAVAAETPTPRKKARVDSSKAEGRITQEEQEYLRSSTANAQRVCHCRLSMLSKGDAEMSIQALKIVKMRRGTVSADALSGWCSSAGAPQYGMPRFSGSQVHFITAMEEAMRLVRLERQSKRKATVESVLAERDEAIAAGVLVAGALGAGHAAPSVSKASSSSGGTASSSSSSSGTASSSSSSSGTASSSSSGKAMLRDIDGNLMTQDEYAARMRDWDMQLAEQAKLDALLKRQRLAKAAAAKEAAEAAAAKEAAEAAAAKEAAEAAAATEVVERAEVAEVLARLVEDVGTAAEVAETVPEVIAEVVQAAVAESAPVANEVTDLAAEEDAEEAAIIAEMEAAAAEVTAAAQRKIAEVRQKRLLALEKK